jgi:hypothetical protein
VHACTSPSSAPKFPAAPRRARRSRRSGSHGRRYARVLPLSLSRHGRRVAAASAIAVARP